MTLSDNEKNNLIDYRLKQAKETIKTAELLVQQESFPTALNRIYYSVFYCLLALGLEYKFETSKHSQLIGWFNKNFVSTGKVDVKFGKIVRKCYEYRLSADYDAFVVFEKENVEMLLKSAQSFIKRMEELLS